MVLTPHPVCACVRGCVCVCVNKTFAINVLPPENSPWAELEIFFEYLLSQLYHNPCDSIYICGDFNARIGKEIDCLPFDKLPERVALDTTKNSYSGVFLDFLKDAKCCVLNGRFDKKKDNPTCRGNSVVDYIVTPHDCFVNCKNFEVIPMHGLVNDYQLYSLINTKSKVPDHSIICVDVYGGHQCNQSRSLNEKDIGTNCENKKFDLDRIPEGFMANINWSENIGAIIDKLQLSRGEQKEINEIYVEFCKVVTNEMDLFLSYKSQSYASRKKFKSHKPFWNSELTHLWKNMCQNEKRFKRYTGNREHKTELKTAFMLSRKVFDKKLRFYERQYNKKFIDRIEQINTSNPKAFWKTIKKLGPQKEKFQ